METKSTTLTVAALYETREVAERVATALKAQGLGGDLEIRDAEHDDAKHNGLGGWLSGLFSGHDDHHTYAEGLRRGHVLVAVKVDDLNETRAASIMDAAAGNLGAAESQWRGEGWAPGTSGGSSETCPSPGESEGVIAGGAYTATFGGVRSYTL